MYIHTDGQVTVTLYMLRGPILIVPHPTGVHYENQTNGMAISHQSMEGFLVPMTWEGDLPRVLCRHWYEAGGPWSGWLGTKSKPTGEDEYDNTEEIADEIERWIDSKVNKMSFVELKVDRDKRNWEAWYHVKVKFNSEGAWHDCILTWENCD